MVNRNHEQHIRNCIFNLKVLRIRPADRLLQTLRRHQPNSVLSSGANLVFPDSCNSAMEIYPIGNQLSVPQYTCLCDISARYGHCHSLLMGSSGCRLGAYTAGGGAFKRSGHLRTASRSSLYFDALGAPAFVRPKHSEIDQSAYTYSCNESDSNCSQSDTERCAYLYRGSENDSNFSHSDNGRSDNLKPITNSASNTAAHYTKKKSAQLERNVRPPQHAGFTRVLLKAVGHLLLGIHLSHKTSLTNFKFPAHFYLIDIPPTVSRKWLRLRHNSLVTKKAKCHSDGDKKPHQRRHCKHDHRKKSSRNPATDNHRKHSERHHHAAIGQNKSVVNTKSVIRAKPSKRSTADVTRKRPPTSAARSAGESTQSRV